MITLLERKFQSHNNSVHSNVHKAAISEPSAALLLRSPITPNFWLFNINTMKYSLILFAALTLAGCAATGPAFSPVQAPDYASKQALVYIYRTDTVALSGRNAYLYVDEVNVADLSRNGYTWFTAPAGTYQLKQKWPIDVAITKKLEMTANWEAGRTYYYRLSTGIENNPSTLKIRWELSQVESEVAMREMQSTKHMPAFGVPKLLLTKTAQ